MSPKSKLTPLESIEWIGKQFCFREGVMAGSRAKWASLFARWLLFAV